LIERREITRDTPANLLTVCRQFNPAERIVSGFEPKWDFC
jgi:hypothetical protein